MFWNIYSLLVVIVALSMTAGLILLLRPLLVRYALAEPSSRSSHQTPTPQGGGIAVVLATLCVSAAALSAFPERTSGQFSELGFIFAGTAVLALLGALDDVVQLPAAPRLLVQALAVGLAISALAPDMRVLPALPGWLERSLLLLAGLWFVNLFNFMDGIDWMTVAEVVPVTLGLGAIGLWGGLPANALTIDLALLGATLGFAPFNRPVARLFLGDVGSLPIGLLIGWLLVLLAGSGHLLAAFLLPFYYVADATITLLTRVLRGERVWQAHRQHFYQRAIDRGARVGGVVGRVFLVNLGLAGLGTLVVALPLTGVGIGSLAAGALLVGWLLWRLCWPPKASCQHPGPEG